MMLFLAEALIICCISRLVWMAFHQLDRIEAKIDALGDPRTHPWPSGDTSASPQNRPNRPL